MAAGGRGRAARSSLGLGPAGQPRQQTVAQRARREEPARPRRDSRAGPPRSSGSPRRGPGAACVCARAPAPPPRATQQNPHGQAASHALPGTRSPGAHAGSLPISPLSQGKAKFRGPWGPPSPHNCSMPLGPACTSGGNGPCCPLRQPRAQGADSGTQRAGRWHYPRAPWGHGEQSLGLAHLHLGTRRHPPQAAPGTEVGKGP